MVRGWVASPMMRTCCAGEPTKPRTITVTLGSMHIGRSRAVMSVASWVGERPAATMSGTRGSETRRRDVPAGRSCSTPARDRRRRPAHRRGRSRSPVRPTPVGTAALSGGGALELVQPAECEGKNGRDNAKETL